MSASGRPSRSTRSHNPQYGDNGYSHGDPDVSSPPRSKYTVRLRRPHGASTQLGYQDAVSHAREAGATFLEGKRRSIRISAHSEKSRTLHHQPLQKVQRKRPHNRQLRQRSKLVHLAPSDGLRDVAKRKIQVAESGPEDEEMNGTYKEEEDDENDEEEEEEEEGQGEQFSTRQSRSGRRIVQSYKEDDDDDDSDGPVGPKRRSLASKPSSMGGFVVEDEEEDADGAFRASGGRRSSSRLKRAASSASKMANLAAKRRKRRKSQLSSDYEDNGDATMSEDEEDEDEGEPEEEEEESDEAGPRSYSLRRRTKKVDYRLVPPQEPLRDGFGKKVRSRSRSGPGGSAYDVDAMDSLPALSGPSRAAKARENWNGLPLSMSGRDYDRYFGGANGDDSSDDDIPASRKPGAGPAAFLGGPAASGLIGAGGASAGGSGLGPDLGAGRDAVGRMKGTTELADIDPLGVNMQVDFDSVGGLDGHIQQLKEMVSLPLLYPEVFQRFKVTPPRGVLFHGPPGTGKTLVARALAASCSSSGQQISFFMRKGADCLSKWVGEAERQLRLLFEEAKNAQPSIIFFDEIDGLAPVRSSKQDQIHASIVSTLLALMDGMDGRGQVVVIGATNRPDSVDPALRRPGRFDREFYFPLPNREARKSIININTKEWEPPLDEAFKEKLAEVTKGYGGADLRALCTEAALNAIQRRYPQIYQTTDRLELKPETIRVDARDFMMSVNKVVPSSARSAGSAASPLKEHLKPLLEQAVHSATQALERVMPPTSKRNPLEEAQWEDDEPSTSDGGFGRELLLQSFEQLRVFRPRLVVHGRAGMGQGYIGSALLHHLEGYHVQTLDAGTLLGDSGTTIEASVVQMFNEAKRHKPSVLYIPALAKWSDTVTESARATFKTLLDGLAPSDPILLVAVSEGSFEDLPRDIRTWFGFTKENRVALSVPDIHKRRAYFDELLKNITKAPNEFPDGMPRRKRVLEDLPKAPPRAPRVPTEAELRAQKDDDDRILNDLKFRLGPILAELKKKFPRFKRDVWQEYNLYELTQQFEWRKEKNKVIVTLLYEPGSQLLQRIQATTGDEDSFVGRQEAGSAPGVETESHSISQGEALDDAEKQVIAAETNGFSNHSDPAPVQAQAQLQIPGINEPMANASSDDEKVHSIESGLPLSGLAAAMTGDFSSANPPPMNSMPHGSARFRQDGSGFFVRDLPIWTVNLEKMQKRLYYNGYLTVSDFIEDVRRIVSNAEEAQEVDEDRLSRANQLFITASYLADQYFDADFRLRCSRMAERTLQRELDLRQAEERKKKEKEDLARIPKGERHSSRLHGEEPTSATLDELAALERKRSRQSAEGDLSMQGGSKEVSSTNEETRKKMRTDDGDTSMLVPDASLAANQLQGIDWSTSDANALATSHDSSSSIVRPTPTSSAPLPLPSHLNGDRAESPARHLLHSHHPGVIAATAGANESILSPIVKAIAHTPSVPSTPHPPFTYDAGQLKGIEQQLIQATATFSVEQLEHLRASLFTLIWNRRSEWDKSSLMTEVASMTHEIAQEVDAFNREEEMEEEAEHAP